MAAGLADLGNSIGYLYKTKINGTTIVSVERNTVPGVQAMIQMGAGNAPLAAQRSAYSIITVVSSGGAGSITNVTINGVNQIGAPIVVTSANVQVVAEQIADAINAYSPSGFAFTANKPYPNFAFVFIYSAPANGTAVNGLTPIISATDPGLTFFTSPFVNGSNDAGVFDDQFGYRFWMYANSAAVPDTVDPNAVEITSVLTLRGSNTGIITKNLNVTQSSLLGIERACDTTQIITDTGGAPATTLGFIETINFVEGDILRLRNNVPTRVTTLEDATVNTTAQTPNIYLTDAAPFALTGFNSITLQYRYDNSLGPIWVETGRSITNSPITITLAQFLTDAGAGDLRPGARYFVSDLSTGVYIYAVDGTTYEQSGVLRRYIPVNYAGCWRSNMAAPVVNQTYKYYQRSYKSLTGVVGTAPDTDAVNWQLIPYSTPGAYLIQYHNVLLTEPPLMLTWPICEERDGNGNCVIQSYQHFSSTGINAFNAFCWNQALGLNYYGNYVCDSIFDVANSDGPVFENMVTEGSVFVSNIMDASSIISKNTITNGSIVQNNNFRSFNQNTLISSLVQNNFNGTNKAPNILANYMNGGNIVSNYGTSNSCSINNNTLNFGSGLSNNNLSSRGKIELNVCENVSQIQNCVILNTTSPTHINNNKLNNSILEYIQYGAGDGSTLYKNTLNDSTIKINSAVGSTGIDNSIFNLCYINNWRTFGASSSTFTNCSISPQLDCAFNTANITNWSPIFAFNANSLGVISGTVVIGESSTISYQLDLDNPAIYAANILTIPYEKHLAGTISLVSANPTVTIDEVVDLPEFKEIRFYNETLGGCAITFNKVSPAAWSGNLIVGAANFTINSDATGVTDFMTMGKYYGAINMITGGVNFV